MKNKLNVSKGSTLVILGPGFLTVNFFSFVTVGTLEQCSLFTVITPCCTLFECLLLKSVGTSFAEVSLQVSSRNSKTSSSVSLSISTH